MDPAGPVPTINYANFQSKGIANPHPHDVLCGRGGGTNNHVGNSHWRMLVAANKQLYVTLPKRQKMLLSRSIVNAVRAQNPPGRFLQKDAKSDDWYDVGDQRAQEKTSQALREGAPEIRKDGQTDPTCINSGSPVPHTSNNAYQTSSTPVGVPSTATVASATASASVTVVSPLPVATAYSITAADGSNIQQMPPPGSHPIMVTYQTPNGPQTMPMYPAMMVPGPNGTMVPAMPLIMQQQQQQQQTQTSSPPVPSPCTTPGMNANSNATNNVMNMTIPPPTNPAISPTPSSVMMPPPSRTGAFQTFLSTTQVQEEQEHQYTTNHGGVGSDLDAPGMVDGGLEPAGLSMGTIESVSMISFVGNGKLEPVGTSFGSVMSFSVASRGPDMVDGGLEPVGTSFGSLSLNSNDEHNLQHALGSSAPNVVGPSSFNRPNQKASLTQNNANNTYSTPTLFAEQRSKGNLLECSDTESDDDDEIPAALQANKTAEWEKLQAMLSQQTMSQSRDQHISFQMPTSGIQMPPEGLPTTTFEHNFSELSAMSMGNDFRMDSPDVQLIRKQIQVPDFSYNNNHHHLQGTHPSYGNDQAYDNNNHIQGAPPSYGNDQAYNNNHHHHQAHVSAYSNSFTNDPGPAHSYHTPAYNNLAHNNPEPFLYQRQYDDDFDDAPLPVGLSKANEEDAENLEIMFLSRGGSLVFDEFEGQQEQV
jgi:hypothetical protein